MYTYCGKTWSETDIENIRRLITAAPRARRAELARQVCATFDWWRVNGLPNLMSCKVAMIRMCRDGLIELPPPRSVYRVAGQGTFSSEASDPKPTRELRLAELKELRVELVPRGSPLALWNELISRHHYLGYRITPGAQLRYFVYADGELLCAMGFGGAAWKVAPRDRFIGWTAPERERRLHLIVNQTRFLILPWVRCQNLATKVLAMALRRLPGDWEERYGYRPALIETFVDQRFHGTSYKAGNWLKVGLTQGRSRMDRDHRRDQPIKSIWVMPLRPDFRAVLQNRREGG